jgi:GNAT acetyltransferase-like protein
MGLSSTVGGMIVSRGRFCRVGTVFFENRLPDVARDFDVDILRHIHVPGPVATPYFCETWTILIDLTQDPKALMDAIKKEARYKIRRAEERDDLDYVVVPGNTSDALREFCDFYDRFAARKRRPRCARQFLRAIAEAGALDLSVLRREGETLVWHAHYRTPTRAMLLESASLYMESDDTGYRNLIGRGNRYMHWRDMLRFKDDGIAVYDFGGWYEGKSDQAKLGINRFKEDFGGQIVRSFSSMQPRTFRGRLALWARATAAAASGGRRRVA